MNKVRLSAIEKELKKIESEENALLSNHVSSEQFETIIEKLKTKIPASVTNTLHSAFSKAFSFIFINGSGFITGQNLREKIRQEYKIRDYAVTLRGSRKDIRRMTSYIETDNALLMAITAAEGIGLGIFGIGLPDIPIWLGVLTSSICRTALKYGFDCESPYEKKIILKIIETALLPGAKQIQSNNELDSLMADGEITIDKSDLMSQIEKTSSVFATELLVMKFIQGIPIAGVIGGLSDPLYFYKIMRFAQIKYKKRYLLDKISQNDSDNTPIAEDECI